MAIMEYGAKYWTWGRGVDVFQPDDSLYENIFASIKSTSRLGSPQPHPVRVP